MYRFGEGVPQDDAEAVKWARKAAEQGEDPSFGVSAFYVCLPRFLQRLAGDATSVCAYVQT